MLRAIDVFSGCGGLTTGLRRAGFEVCAAIEIDARASHTYALNHPKVTQYKDICSLSGPRVMRDLGLHRGELDLLAGCPPCQGFSRIRTKNARTSVYDPRNDLISQFLRLVKSLLPKAVLLENVPALRRSTRLHAFRSALRKLGYEIDLDVLDAADYGVPQRRKRLILVASRVFTPSLVRRKLREKATVRNALVGLKVRNDKLHKLPESRSKEMMQRIRLTPKNGGSRSDLPPKFALKCHKGRDGFGDVYGRMRWDEPAPTITSGCTNPSKGRFLHPTKNRTITLREAALLQGFPRSYKFDVSHGKERIALMIGNAFPPGFVATQARAVRRSLQATSRPKSLRQ